MGAAASADLQMKMDHIKKVEDPSEEDIRAVISELHSAVREKARRIFDDMLEDQYLYDVARMRGSLAESNWRAEIETGAKPAARVGIEEDMRKARETWKRPLSLPAINRPEGDPNGGNQIGEALYNPPPEAYPDYSKVPRGSIIHIDDFEGAGERSIFPGIKRDIEIYLPSQLTPDMEPALILFNDGSDMFEDIYACEVLDSLIHAGTIPVTVGVFVQPGRPTACPARRKLLAEVGIFPHNFREMDWSKFEEDRRAHLQRQIEYDSVTDLYPRFLRDELLPFVLEQAKLKNFSSDPGQKCILGISSGGMQAFNTAWHDPQSWGRVLSYCGSFVALNGGLNYPFIIRRSDRTARKNLRIVLTSGSNHNDDQYGNFALANHTMADALRYAGYDYRYDFGTGGHNTFHGRALLAEHLRWLFKEYSQS